MSTYSLKPSDVFSMLRRLGHKLIRRRFQTPPTAPEETAVNNLAEMLVEMNVRYLRTNPRTPSPKDAHIRDIRCDPLEVRRTIPSMLRDQRGTSTDLAAYRVAWLREHGEPEARFLMVRTESEKAVLYTVWVQRADGTLEVPRDLFEAGE